MILERPNRFIIDVLLNGEMASCHCPAVTRLGNLYLTGRPCLVSESGNKGFKMPFTIETFSLDPLDAAAQQWIGINQTASNRYVEHFIKQGAFLAPPSAMRHLRELAASLTNHDRAVVLYCLYYDNPSFRFYHGATYDEVMRTV